MPQLMLSDEHWLKLRTIMRMENIYDKPKHRLIVEGIFYRLRVGFAGGNLTLAEIM